MGSLNEQKDKRHCANGYSESDPGYLNHPHVKKQPWGSMSSTTHQEKYPARFGCACPQVHGVSEESETLQSMIMGGGGGGERREELSNVHAVI